MSAYCRVRRPPTEPPSKRVGYIILLCSVVFLVLGSYATLFSAFLPEIRVFGYPVSLLPFTLSLRLSALDANSNTHEGLCIGAWNPFSGYPLQVFRGIAGAHERVLCYRKLGWMAILSELLKYFRPRYWDPRL